MMCHGKTVVQITMQDACNQVSTKGKTLGNYAFIPLEYFSERKWSSADGWLLASHYAGGLEK